MSRNGLARTWQQVLQPHSLSATTRCRRHAFSTTVLVLAIALALPGTPAASDAPVPETIVFGGDADYPPFEWLDDGSPTGFNIELEQAIAEAGARKARHRLGNWADAVRALEAGTVDAVPMFQTPQREQRFLFSDPIHFVETEAFGLASAGNIDQPSDLSGKRVAVERGSHAAPRLRSDVATIELVETKDTLAALRSVAAGHAEYAVLSTLVARQLIRRHGLPLERKGPPLWSHPYAFAVTRDREALADWIDRSFDRMVATGEFGRIHARWEDQLDPTPINWRHVLEFAGLIAAPLLLLAGLVLAWNRLLQNRVTARTAELSAELERRLEAEASLRHHAQYEIATGLPRRWHFLGLADEALARATPGARAEIIVLHFRNLDEITRFFGHAKGESGQRAFAERLRACELDAIGHFGGRTFAAVATGTHVGTLIESLSATLSIESLEFNPVVLAGVARAPDHGMCASDLVPRAETALTGVTGPRSTWAMYDESMEPDSDDLQLVRDFQQGDGGGMYAVYQPQVDLSDGACVGCEALVR